MQQGAHAIELDVKLSNDGQVVVIHDPTLERTTGATGKVSETPFSAIRDLEAGSFFGEQFRGEPVPLLAEVFELVDRKIFINIELTNYTTPGDDLVDRVAGLIIKMDYRDRILFSSFNPRNLVRARRLLPDIPCGLLALPGLPGLWARSFLGRWTPHEALHPFISDVNPGLVHWAHRMGRRVHVWTVNKVSEMTRLRDMQVDGIFTDDPLLALQMMADIGQPPQGIEQG
jgi:glycerophosphoryl diester phosphodiesterase